MGWRRSHERGAPGAETERNQRQEADRGDAPRQAAGVTDLPGGFACVHEMSPRRRTASVGDAPITGLVWWRLRRMHTALPHGSRALNPCSRVMR
jgi:hypothetical protein